MRAKDDVQQTAGDRLAALFQGDLVTSSSVSGLGPGRPELRRRSDPWLMRTAEAFAGSRKDTAEQDLPEREAWPNYPTSNGGMGHDGPHADLPGPCRAGLASAGSSVTPIFIRLLARQSA